MGTKLERMLVQLTIFLIPTNLAWHWYGEWGYVHGRLVDYLLPKFYVSDLPIVGLFILLVFKYISSHSLFNLFNTFFSSMKKVFRQYWKLIFPFLTLVYFLVRSRWTTQPISSTWYALKMVEFGFFGGYLVVRYTLSKFLDLMRTPLLFSLLSQSIIGLYQFIMQKSIFGYLFFGEASLDKLGIATENYFGRLLIPPYGTTPHPNVLAGFFCIGLLLILTGQWLSKNILSYIYLGLIVSVLLLAVSWESYLSLFLGLSLITASHYISTRLVSLLFLIILTSSYLIIPLFLHLSYTAPFAQNNVSILTRDELNRTAMRIFLDNFWIGVGPNQFTWILSSDGFQVGQKTFVFQPVHNLLLLIAAETGLIGLLLVFGTMEAAWTIISTREVRLVRFLPLFCLLIIGVTDHYPLTLQTGQLLLSLTAVLPLMHD